MHELPITFFQNRNKKTGLAVLVGASDGDSVGPPLAVERLHVKEMGGMVLMLGVLLWLASRDPVRNVAIVDALIVGLCILAVTPLLSLWMTDIRSMYPAYLLWGRSAVRLAIAALLYWLRPREARWEPVGSF